MLADGFPVDSPDAHAAPVTIDDPEFRLQVDHFPFTPHLSQIRQLYQPSRKWYIFQCALARTQCET